MFKTIGVNEHISKLGGYFRKMNIAEGIIFVTVAFPDGWKINTKISEKYDVKVMATEDHVGFYFATELSNGFDNLFNAIHDTITFNEVAGIKKALFIEKVNELQKLFEEEPLDVLETIEFKFSHKKKSTGKRTKKTEMVDVIENNEVKNEEPCPAV